MDMTVDVVLKRLQGRLGVVSHLHDRERLLSEILALLRQRQPSFSTDDKGSSEFLL